MCTTFSILTQNILPPDAFFVLNENNTRTTHPFKLQIPWCRLNIKKFDFSSRIIKPWNNLPTEIVNSRTVDEFRRKIEYVDFTEYLQGPYPKRYITSLGAPFHTKWMLNDSLWILILRLYNVLFTMYLVNQTFLISGPKIKAVSVHCKHNLF